MNPYRETPHTKHFYVGTNGFALCIDQLTGKTVWQVELRASLTSSLATLLLHGDRLYGACYRHIACLARSDGKVLWRTNEKTLLEPLALALDPLENQIIAAGGGHLNAFSADSGALMWQNDLPGLGHQPLCLRVPDAIVAQPTVHWVGGGNSRRLQQVDNEQYGD